MSNLLPLLQLLRLASPGLPIGGFSYSQGLESALELGLVRDAASAQQWLHDVLQGPVCQFDAAMLAQMLQAVADGDEAALYRLNQRYLASRDNREQRQETIQMGYSLRQLLAGLPEGQSMCRPDGLAMMKSARPPPGRWPPVHSALPAAKR
jgi:urease accessory protein